MPHSLIAAIVLGAAVFAVLAVVVAVGPLVVLRAFGGLLRRYRWQLTPLFTSAALAVIAVIGRYRLLWPLRYTLPGLALVAVVTVAAGWRQFRQPTDRAYLTACTTVGVGLAVTGILTGASLPLTITWITVTIAAWIPWLRHTRVQARIRTQRIVEGWPQFAERAGIAGAKLQALITIAGGYIYRFRRPVDLPHANVDKHRFNDALDAVPGTVTEIRQPADMSSRVTEVVVLNTPQWGRHGQHATLHPAVAALPRLEESLLASLESGRLVKPFTDIGADDPAALWIPGRQTCTRPKLIGYAGSSEQIHLNSWAADSGAVSTLIVGQTRSGKTNAVQALLASTAACRDEIVWAIELAKSGANFWPWRKWLDWVALDADEAEDMLTDALAVIAGRPQERVRRMEAGERGLGDKDRPSPRLPLLTILVDEAAKACANYTLLRRMVDVAQTGPEAAVRLVVVSQRCDTDTIPSALRAQLREVVGLRMDSRDVPMAFPDHAAAIHMDAFRVAGSLIVRSPTGELSPLGRSCTTNDLEINGRLAELYAPYRATLEPAAVEWTQHYTDRNRNPFNRRPIPKPTTTTTASATIPKVQTMTVPTQPGSPDADPAYADAAASLESARAAFQAAQQVRTPPIPMGALVPDTPYVPDLDDKDHEIVHVLRQAGPTGATTGDVAKVVGLHRSTVLARLQNIQAAGLVRSAGRPPAGVRWYADNPNENQA